MCAPQGREGRLWQLLMAEEVRRELMGHQESPSRAMARCKWCQDIILIVMCATMAETCGSYHRRPRKGLAWGRGLCSTALALAPTRPQIPSRSSGSVYTRAHTHTHQHQCHNFGKEGWEAMRASEGSDQRGTWIKMGWVICYKGTARTLEMLLVIGAGGMASLGLGQRWSPPGP